MTMIPDMLVSEIVGFMKMYIYMLVIVAAVMVLYKNHKTSKAVYDLCASQDECRDTINKMIEYAQTSDDTAANRLNYVAHTAAVIESIIEIYKLFKYSIDSHIAFSREWANNELTFSKLYDKSFSKAILSLDEVESGKYVCHSDINYKSLVDGASGIEDDDEWSDWMDMNICLLRTYIRSENQAIMNVAVANILQIPIEAKNSGEI